MAFLSMGQPVLGDGLDVRHFGVEAGQALDESHQGLDFP
jgi:hypothetical protein